MSLITNTSGGSIPQMWRGPEGVGSKPLFHSVRDIALIIDKTVKSEIIIRFEYPLINDVMRIIKEFEAQIITQQFATECLIKISVSRQFEGVLRTKLENIFGVNIEL